MSNSKGVSPSTNSAPTHDGSVALVHAIRMLADGYDLSKEQMALAMEEIARGDATPVLMAGFLMALRIKGETVDELIGATTVLRQYIKRVSFNFSGIVDTCGTGGGSTKTFNISTAAALVAASAGAVVAKHGNRSFSSQCGSADVLESLGVELGIGEDSGQLVRCLEAARIAFLFAPQHHPAFAAAVPVRKQLGVATIFNLVGPLANPAGARRQLVGVYEQRYASVIAKTLLALGAEHALIVHSEGMDEISVGGTTKVYEVKKGQITEFELTPERLGLSRWPLDDLRGGDPQQNAAIIHNVLAGAKGAPRDAVLANAGATLYVADVASSIAEGVGQAALAIDDGRAKLSLAALIAASQAEVPGQAKLT